jgi:hypothetical protein
VSTITLSPVDEQRAEVLVKHGILMPKRCIVACEATGLPLALGGSILMQESGGGRNVWGHDPTIFIGGFDKKNNVNHGPNVDEAGYKAYLAQRGPKGAGGMQGVGPVQLTYYSFQDEADALGGCWDALNNMKVGFGHLAASIKRNGMRAGIVAYNGSGSAAERYADTVIARQATIQRDLDALKK